MKKIYSLAAILSIAVLLFNSCSKKNSDIVTPIDPKPPVQTTDLILPKKEMRAVWLTTAWGIDWPQADYTMESQKMQYIGYLEKLKELNFNTIIFQVKPMGDAFYQSAYEPWSAAITGVRGKNPGYDVLKFMIDEAHARGIEFHAWMNPYRIGTRASSASAYPALHESIPASWVVSHEKIQIYNPAVPEVRQRLADIVKDMILKYNVDGIHFDDYFYPDPAAAGTMVSDTQDYSKYGAGYSTIQDFRRANVDLAIKAVHDVILATRPEVVFSVSPAASRAYNLNTLYADIVKWCQEGWIDILMPQLYQEIGNPSNDFQQNLNIWTQFSYKASVVVGHALYKFGDATAGTAFQSTAELEKQFSLTKGNKKVLGNAQYSAKYLMQNKISITNKLAEIYKNKAVMPFFGRNIAALPATPVNLRIENSSLKWNGTATQFVVYYFTDLKKEGRVLAITKDPSLPVTENGYYAVTALNADYAESKITASVEKK